MSPSDAIGGYFGLELAPPRGHFHSSAQRFQSARAALLALLKCGQPRRVWVPWFVCDTLRDAVSAAGIQVERYGLDESLRIGAGLALAGDDWLLYVNYFGVCDTQVDDTLRRFPAQQVIVDNAQAFFATAGNCRATLYSPRKFFGVADGGYLITSVAVPTPSTTDEATPQRCAHLLLRPDCGAEAGYASFLAAEESLQNQPPLRMSSLTDMMLASIDYEHARQLRRENFQVLHAALGGSNLLSVALGATGAPLCYPYRTARPELRQRLIAARIFVPTYWPEVAASDAPAPAFERDLARTILPLPCDQRYSREAMGRIIETIRGA